MTEDELIGEYAAILRNIYDHQTAGDYTFEGVLAEFVRRLDGIER